MKQTNLILLLGIVFPLPSLLHANPIFGDFAVVDDLPTETQNAVWFEGTFGEGILDYDLEGPGTRMFWYPGMAAFRGGQNTGGWWSGWSNIGAHSLAWGLNNEASGTGSTVFGPYGIAGGSASFSAGDENWAMGAGSTSFGAWTVATGSAAFSAGFTTAAIGHSSFAVNDSTIAAGTASFSAGLNTRADSLSEFVIGRFNVPSGGQVTNWFSSDPLFVIGNGTGANPSNAMTVLKSGNVGLGILAPQHRLHVEGNTRISGTLILDGTLATTNPSSVLNVAGKVGIGQSPAHELDVNGDVRWSGILQGGSVPWGRLTEVPPSFPPSSHSHPISEVSGLQDELNDKLDLSGGVLTGALGIGIPSPADALDVAGRVRSSSGYNVGANAVVDASGRLSAFSSTSTNPGLTITGNRPNSVYNAVNLTGGLAFSLLKVNLTNTDSLTASNAGIVGIYGSANVGQSPAQPPIGNYLYLDARGSASHWSGSTLKITPDNKVGIGLPGSDKPSETLEVNGSVKITGDLIAQVPPRGGILMGEFGD